MFRQFPFIYWLFAEDLGFEKYLDIINSASKFYFYTIDNIYYEIIPSNSLLALNSLKISLESNKISNSYLTEAINLYIKFILSKILKRQDTMEVDFLPNYLTLNQDCFYSSIYNFEDIISELSNLGRISKLSINKLRHKKDLSFYMFLNSRIIRLPKEELEILKNFDGFHRTNDNIGYLIKIKKTNSTWVKNRIKFLYKNLILI